jgi:ankyrin repeat protein
MLAAVKGDQQTVELLLKGGADPSLRNKIKKRAEDLAKSAGHAAVAEQIRGYRKEKWLGIF